VGHHTINAEITMQMPDIEDVVAVPEIDLGWILGTSLSAA